MNPPAAPASNVVAAPAAPRISFLIPIFNGLELTRVCLRTLAETVDLSRHEVILINDASTDGTAEFLDQLPPPHRVLHNSSRSCYAAGMNRGVALARGEMLCLLNNDLVFRPDWLPPMLRAFDKFPRAGVVGNVQINPRTGKYDHMGIIFADDGIPHHFGREFGFRPFRGYTEWRAVTAACCLVKKSVFLGAGGFDEAYRNGCEDMELCLALGRQGYRHFVANASVIAHHGAASEGRMNFESQNEQLFLRRWREYLQQNLGPRDRRRFAANFLLPYLSEPRRHRGKKFRHAVLTLLKCGH